MNATEMKAVFKRAKLFGFAAMVNNLEQSEKRGEMAVQISMDITPIGVDPLSEKAMFSPRLRLGYENQTPLETLSVFADVIISPSYDERTKKAFLQIDKTLANVARAEEEFRRKTNAAVRLLKPLDAFRLQKNHAEARRIRKEIKALGFGVKSTRTHSWLAPLPFREHFKKRRV